MVRLRTPRGPECIVQASIAERRHLELRRIAAEAHTSMAELLRRATRVYLESLGRDPGECTCGSQRFRTMSEGGGRHSVGCPMYVGDNDQ